MELSHQDIQSIFKYIYKHVSLTSVKYKGMFYDPIEYSDCKYSEESHTPTDISKDYYYKGMCPLHRESLGPRLYIDDINARYEFTVNDDNFTDTPEPIKSVLLSPGKTYTLAYDLCILNKEGPCMDHRGSTHCGVGLRYYDKWTIFKGPVTLYDFMNAAFRLKSHKFDNWYEQVYGLDSSTWEILPGDIHQVCLKIDHGS